MRTEMPGAGVWSIIPSTIPAGAVLLYTPSIAVFWGLQRYPGIGVKTAACILLFCMQRPAFAVDTHVWRLCKWLSWVPENATRDQVFAHCDVRVPDELKCSLHQLMIVHGKECGRCKAITGENSVGWEETTCVLEHLVKRTGMRKGTTLLALLPTYSHHTHIAPAIRFANRTGGLISKPWPLARMEEKQLATWLALVNFPKFSHANWFSREDS